MATTTPQQAVALTEQINSVPAPAEMFGVNLSGAITENADRIASFGEITTDEQRIAFDAFLREGDKVVKVAGEKRLEITRILDAIKTQYTSAEKGALGPLVKALAKGKEKVTAFLREQARLAQLEQQRILEEQQKAANRKRSDAGRAEVASQTEQLLEAAAPNMTGAALVWQFEVEAAGDVPRPYLEVNEAAIKQAVAAGVREIPGVRIYQDVRRTGR